MPPAKADEKGRRGAQKPAEKPKARAASRGVKASPLPDAKAKGALTVHQGLDFERKIDLVGMALLCFAGVAFAAVLPSVSFGLLAEPETGLTGSLNDVLSQMFGWGKIVWPVVAAAVGIWLMKAHFVDTGFELDYFRVIGLISLYACALTWLQMIELIDNTAPTIEAFKPISHDLAIEQARGGGWLGHQLYLFLLSQFLDVGALSVLIAWLVVSLMLSFDLSVVELWGFVAGAILFLRPNPEARARRKAAQEARTADIIAAMRPGESTVSPGTTVAAAPVPTKTQETPAVVEPERRRFGLKRVVRKKHHPRLPLYLPRPQTSLPPGPAHRSSGAARKAVRRPVPKREQIGLLRRPPPTNAPIRSRACQSAAGCPISHGLRSWQPPARRRLPARRLRKWIRAKIRQARGSRVFCGGVERLRHPKKQM
jgi:hypothetical protein